MLQLALVGIVLALLLFVAALPWLAALDLDGFRALARRPASWGWALGGSVGSGLILGFLLGAVQDRERLQLYGRSYGSILSILLLADIFVLALVLLLACWPRGGAVALAAFREAIRQPLFWLMAGGAAVLLLISVIVPYFTFGEDFKRMKGIGFDLVRMATILFAVVTASMSISDEIEGRTAITLMSKPLSRRQFLLGKFAGILLAALVMIALLGWCLNWALYVKPWFDPFDDATDPLQVQLEPSLFGLAHALVSEGEASHFLEGLAGWFGIALAILPGLAIGACKVMLFLALAAALATRLPLGVNLASCLAVFFLGNLAPYLLQYSQNLQRDYRLVHQGEDSAAYNLMEFSARLGDTVLPALEYFDLGPAVIRDKPLPLDAYLAHVANVAGYSILYTAIALLLGLILFEDRDLA